MDEIKTDLTQKLQQFYRNIFIEITHLQNILLFCELFCHVRIKSVFRETIKKVRRCKKTLSIQGVSRLGDQLLDTRNLLQFLMILNFK